MTKRKLKEENSQGKSAHYKEKNLENHSPHTSGMGYFGEEFWRSKYQKIGATLDHAGIRRVAGVVVCRRHVCLEGGHCAVIRDDLFNAADTIAITSKSHGNKSDSRIPTLNISRFSQ